MNKLFKLMRSAIFAVLLFAVLTAIPARAQFVMGNMTGGPGNIVANSSGYATINSNFYAAYLSGTAYTVTGSLAAVTGGTTSPTITLPTAGTYFIYGDLDSNYVGATFAANQTLTQELYRTNNTPGVISSSPAVITLNVVTTFTGTAATSNVHGVIYTASAGDTITVYAGLSATPSAGSVTITGGGLYAIRLF